MVTISVVVILIFAGLALGLGGLVFWLVIRQRAERQEVRQSLQDKERQLRMVLQLTRKLVEAREESLLVQSVLSTVNELVDGLGSSFVPLDAWGQPLAAFSAGQASEDTIQRWAQYLSTEQVRGRCAQCQMLEAQPEQACPLHTGPLGSEVVVFCFPLMLGECRLGMLNIFLPAGRVLAVSQRGFLQGLFDVMALGIESLRLRSQEEVTLRQLQMMRTPRTDLSLSLNNILESVFAALQLKGLELRVRKLADEKISGMRVKIGSIDEHCDANLEALLQTALQTPEKLEQIEITDCIALPLLLSGGRVIGVLAAVGADVRGMPPAQFAMLQAVTAQSAVMIENERLNRTVEYSMVIQERTRLAREIHDGIAQILAYLKLQSYQMLTALDHANYSRLELLVHENENTLESAYQEIRQTIDSLRLTPEEGLKSWLESACSQFERASGISTTCCVDVDDFNLLPEVQVQLIRVVQEALNNIRKHAGATQVTLTLRKVENGLFLEIVDDGIGFNPNEIPPAARFGLRGMRERSGLMGSELHIVSQPGAGTRVQIALPASLLER